MMIFPVLLLFIPRVLSMNPISALGHSALSKKYVLNKPKSAAIIQAQTPHASPPHQAVDKDSSLCSPFPSCINSPERVAKPISSDTPKSADVKSSEEQHDPSSFKAITLEECLREKANIDRVLAERAKLGPFLIESTERPVIDDLAIFNESVEAIKAKLSGVKTNNFYNNIDAVEQKYQCYGLNRVDVIAIRLYTTAMGFVVNEVLRNYALHDMPIPTNFLPYIYALINGLAKLYRDRERNEACSAHELQPLKVIRYISLDTPEKKNAVQPILDAHQPGAYVMYPAFTSSSVNDLAKDLYLGKFRYRFEIQAKTAIAIYNLSIYPREYEAIFLPGTVFHVLERNDPHIVLEDMLLQKLLARQAQLPC